MDKLKLTEKQIARTCGDFLKLDGWRILWMEPISRREWGKGTGEKGMPDLLAIRYLFGESVPESEISEFAGVLWIEWKSARGRLAPHQRAWHDAERARGALTIIAGVDFDASIDGWLAWYRESGLNRGRV